MFNPKSKLRQIRRPGHTKRNHIRGSSENIGRTLEGGTNKRPSHIRSLSSSKWFFFLFATCSNGLLYFCFQRREDTKKQPKPSFASSYLCIEIYSFVFLLRSRHQQRFVKPKRHRLSRLIRRRFLKAEHFRFFYLIVTWKRSGITQSNCFYRFHFIQSMEFQVSWRFSSHPSIYVSTNISLSLSLCSTSFRNKSFHLPTYNRSVFWQIILQWWQINYDWFFRSNDLI